MAVKGESFENHFTPNNECSCPMCSTTAADKMRAIRALQVIA